MERKKEKKEKEGEKRKRKKKKQKRKEEKKSAFLLHTSHKEGKGDLFFFFFPLGMELPFPPTPFGIEKEEERDILYATQRFDNVIFVGKTISNIDRLNMETTQDDFHFIYMHNQYALCNKPFVAWLLSIIIQRYKRKKRFQIFIEDAADEREMKAKFDEVKQRIATIRSGYREQQPFLERYTEQRKRKNDINPGRSVTTKNLSRKSTFALSGYRTLFEFIEPQEERKFPLQVSIPYSLRDILSITLRYVQDDWMQQEIREHQNPHKRIRLIREFQ